jgi:hypothetical protein
MWAHAYASTVCEWLAEFFSDFTVHRSVPNDWGLVSVNKKVKPKYNVDLDDAGFTDWVDFIVVQCSVMTNGLLGSI